MLLQYSCGTLENDRMPLYLPQKGSHVIKQGKRHLCLDVTFLDIHRQMPRLLAVYYVV